MLESWGDLVIYECGDRSAHFQEAERPEMFLPFLHRLHEKSGSKAVFTLIGRIERKEYLPPVGRNRAELFRGDFRKILNGKLYDTATATMIDERLQNEWNEMIFVYTRTYETKNGRRFCVVQGGPASSYGKKTATNQWEQHTDMYEIAQEVRHED